MKAAQYISRWLQAHRTYCTMVRRLIFGLAVLITTSCSEKSEADSVDNFEQPELLTTFSSVYDTLDVLNVPITLTPSVWSEMYKLHLDKYTINEGWELLKHPFARLTGNSNYKGIIFVSTDETGSPVLITIDKTDRPIDTLFLLGDWGGNDPSNETREITTINKDYTILLIDSTSTFDIGPDGDRIVSSEKLTATNETYRILDNGKIEKIR